MLLEPFLDSGIKEEFLDLEAFKGRVYRFFRKLKRVIPILNSINYSKAGSNLCPCPVAEDWVWNSRRLPSFTLWFL
jgi:hypothetical protein